MSTKSNTDATTTRTGRLLVIDGHSLAFRAFFGVPADRFTTSTGQYTNAVHGFTAMLITLLTTEAPTHIAVAFDLPGGTFRTERYEEYKGGRSETPPEFSGQIELIQEVLDAMNVPWITVENYEADDILATLAREGRERGMEVLLVSGDRDAFQLVTDEVTVLYPRKGVSDLVRLDPAGVEEKYLVPPANYPDLAALVGESADNLPGVPGVGPKTAAKWIGQYGSLDAILERRDEIKGKVGQSLRDHVEAVLRNRSINRLVDDLPLEAGLDALERADIDRARVERVFDALEFRSLRTRLFDALAAGQPTGGQEGGQGSSLEAPEAVLVPAGTLGRVLGSLSSAPAALAVWPADADPSPAQPREVRGIVVHQGGASHAVDLTDIDPVDDGALGTWLASGAPKLAHHGKRLTHLLRQRGYRLGGLAGDTLLEAYVLQPERRGYELGELAATYLGVELPDPGASSSGQLEMDLGAGEENAGERSRAALEAAVVALLHARLSEGLAEQGAADLVTAIELPLASVLAEMEARGIAVSRPLVEELAAGFESAASRAQEAAFAEIGHPVNLSSPKQLQTVLFDELDLPRTKKIKSGHTTDAAALNELMATHPHPFLVNLLAYRDATKLKQTVEGLAKAVADDGRIHTTYEQTVAATGRLSSTNPNLQNIPIRTDAGRRIRGTFVVGEGYETLLTADYSQIEMRIMAHLSGSKGLIEAFTSGEDLHRYVGSRIFGVQPVEVTPAMRGKVKAMSYGLAYGLSSFGLSKQLGIGVDEARGLMNDYFSRFGEVRDYLRDVVEQAKRDGYTSTIMGRRRYIPDLTSTNFQRRQMAERAALNAPIQGSAADVIKIAMLAVERRLAAEGMRSRMLLQVHDELILEVAPGERQALEKAVVEEMSRAVELDVPLEVHVGVGESWQAAGHD